MPFVNRAQIWNKSNILWRTDKARGIYHSTFRIAYMHHTKILSLVDVWFLSFSHFDTRKFLPCRLIKIYLRKQQHLNDNFTWQTDIRRLQRETPKTDRRLERDEDLSEVSSTCCCTASPWNQLLPPSQRRGRRRNWSGLSFPISQSAR